MAANLESNGAMQMCANHFNDLSLGSLTWKVTTLLSGAPQTMRNISDDAQEGPAVGALFSARRIEFCPDTEYASWMNERPFSPSQGKVFEFNLTKHIYTVCPVLVTDIWWPFQWSTNHPNTFMKIYSYSGHTWRKWQVYIILNKERDIQHFLKSERHSLHLLLENKII